MSTKLTNAPARPPKFPTMQRREPKEEKRNTHPGSLPGQRVLALHRVNRRDRGNKLAPNGGRDRAADLVCHLVGTRFVD